MSTSFWTCSYCTLENEDSRSECEVCHKKNPDNDPNNNKNDRPIDTENKQNMPPKIDNKITKNDSKWQCERCTLFNALSDTKCATCGDPKPLPKTSNEWKCSQCTFVNQSHILKCSMCNTLKQPSNSNSNTNTNTKTTYVWEWKGGSKWHEYSDDISNRIQTSYNNGIIKIDINLGNGKYVIDLSKLQQINTDTQKARKIRCVKYEQLIDNNTASDVDMAEDNSNEKKSDVTAVSNDINEQNVSVNTNTKQLNDLSLNKGNGLMDLSSDSDSDVMENKNKNKNKKKAKKKTVTKKKKKKDVKKNKQGTLLTIFEKEKKESVPAPLGPLKKKKKRKLSDDDENLEDITPKKKKQKTTDISAKYAGKYGGSVLNKDLIDALWELSMIERNSGNKFKANAYSKACKGLKECGVKITSGKQAQNMLKGVGKKIAAKIDELLATGGLKKLDKLRADDTIQGINQLCQIHGIGPKKAAELVKEHGIMTIEELREKGKHLLNVQQKLGLKYFQYINKRIPREQCTKIGEIVRNSLNAIDKNIIMDICGSYRRGKKDCGDVDILLTHMDKKYDQKRYSKQLLIDIVRKLKENKLLVDDLAHGPVKYMGICRYEEAKKKNKEKELPDSVPNNFTFDIPSFDDADMEQDIILTDNTNNTNNNNDSNEYDGYDEESDGKRVYFRRIDLKFINYKFYYGNLLYFTGSDRFNVEMRLKANEKGLILNENGIYKMLDEDDHTKKSKDPVVEPKCEKDIFDVIGMDYVEPKDRSW